jgi:hypothetical protein
MIWPSGQRLIHHLPFKRFEITKLADDSVTKKNYKESNGLDIVC